MELVLNQVVWNFGEICRVCGFHKITGDPILCNIYGNGCSWIGDAEYCTPMTEEDKLRHKDALI